jgi:hypothetical protein
VKPAPQKASFSGTNPEYNLYGEFPASLSAQQIEDNFGSGSDFASRAFFSTPISSLTYAPQEFLGAGFAAGSQVLIATSGTEALAVGTVSSTAEVATFQAANAVQVARQAGTQSVFTAPFIDPAAFMQMAQRFREQALSQARTQAALKVAWDAKLAANDEAGSAFAYWNTVGMSAYTLELRAAAQKVNTIDIGGAIGTTSNARFVVNRQMLTGVFLGTEFETRGPIASVSNRLITHETAHAINFFADNADDTSLDERIGHAVGEMYSDLHAFRGFLENFEKSANALTPAQRLVSLQQLWNDVWIAPNGGGLIEYLLTSVRYTDRMDDNDASNDIVDAKITSAESVEIQNVTGLSISCSDLAAVYSARYGVNLACPAGIDPAFM